jgi:Flp pilus assembly protein TadG
VRVTRIHSSRRAAAAVELAIILPVLTLLALACLDFGRFAYHHIAVTNAARAGAQYAITNSYAPDAEAVWRTQVELSARAELSSQSADDSGSLTTTIAVTVDASGRRQLRVEATYTAFQTLVSWPGIPDNPVLRSAVVVPAIR